MPSPAEPATPRVVSIRRSPVTSMMGEEINACDVTERGLLGDRAYALIDAETGKVAGAKNPRKWPGMFAFRAEFVEPPAAGRAIPAARISFPDGSIGVTGEADLDSRLGAALTRPVRVASAPSGGSTFEIYFPDQPWLARRDEVADVATPVGTFFDQAIVHLVTTATLDRLRELAPGSRFEARRFRPNLIVEVPGAEGFAEDDWIGRSVAIGPDLVLEVSGPCPRCVMTTLEQGDLPRDPQVLRAIVQEHGGHVGVYASVSRAGRVRRGDTVAIG